MGNQGDKQASRSLMHLLLLYIPTTNKSHVLSLERGTSTQDLLLRRSHSSQTSKIQSSRIAKSYARGLAPIIEQTMQLPHTGYVRDRPSHFPAHGLFILPLCNIRSNNATTLFLGSATLSLSLSLNHSAPSKPNRSITKRTNGRNEFSPSHIYRPMCRK